MCLWRFCVILEVCVFVEVLCDFGGFCVFVEVFVCLWRFLCVCGDFCVFVEVLCDCRGFCVFVEVSCIFM